MADTKITDLAALAVTPANGDLFVLVDVSDTTMSGDGTDKNILWSTIVAGIDVAGAITTHAGASDPHGDRAFATAAIATHAGASDPHGDRAFATAAVGTHEADTTSVHGIADTSVLVTLTILATPTITNFTSATHTHQNAAGGGQLDHGAALTGLSDDDHSQYWLLAGRSGQTTAFGGVASGGTFRLDSTTHGTKGNVTFNGTTGGFNASGQLIFLTGVGAWLQCTQFYVGASGNATIKSSGGGRIEMYNDAETVFVRLTLGKVAGSGMVCQPAVSPAQITGDTNNYAPASGGKYRLTSDASRNITGLSISQIEGDSTRIYNVGSNNIVLKHQDTNSTDVNRFLCTTGADITLAANEGALLDYDGTTQRWRTSKL